MKNLEGYRAAFAEEQQRRYPVIDEIEQRYGFAIDRDELEKAAYVLACPVKVNPPNWQHGRVLYAMTRAALTNRSDGVLVDIGTAKGFSACILAKAVRDSGAEDVQVWSVDIVDPDDRVLRNSVAELSGALTVPEFTRDFLPAGVPVNFFGGGSSTMLRELQKLRKNVPLAFVDGKHRYQDVHREASTLREMQDTGDVILFDDVHIPEVREAVMDVCGYRVSTIEVNAMRAYALAVRL